MTVLSQVKEMVEKWRTPIGFLCTKCGWRGSSTTRHDNCDYEAAPVLCSGGDCADDLLALLPAIEAQQEYIEKLEKALAVALADFTNEEQAAAQARLNESPATCYPDGGEIFDECLRARREQLTDKPVNGDNAAQPQGEVK